MTTTTLPYADQGGRRPAVLRAHDLGFGGPGMTLFKGLSFELPAGLTFVRGGEGRGKTTLLKILAGTLKPSSGHVDMVPDSSPRSSTATARVFLADPDGERDSATTAREWILDLSQRFERWDHDLLDDLVQDFNLEDHMDKSMSMLSTGSRRKVAIAAAFASGTELTLLEKPFAALDARSRGVLTDLLQEAAVHPSRAWVLADYELPVGLAPAHLALELNLGD